MARRGASKKATTTSQPKVECAEKSINANSDKQEIGTSDLSSIAGSDVAPHAPFKLDTSNDSGLIDIVHQCITPSPLSGSIVPPHFLTHYQQTSISPDELRGIIAGMAAMAAQSNSVESLC